MKLPIIDVPKYSMVLPISKLKIEYRPYLVKEEVIMLTANTSDDKNDSKNAVVQVLTNCTFNTIDIRKLSMPDISWLLIKLREVSKGEIIDVGITCGNVVNGKTCSAQIESVGNTKDITIEDVPESHGKEIKISDRISITLKYVGIESMDAVLGNGLDDPDTMFDVMIDAVDFIYDNVNDTIYSHEDFNREDIVEFLEQLTTSQIEEIGKFMDTIPKIKLDIDFTCPKCGNKETLVMDSLNDFLV